MGGALKDVKVLDITHVLSGPFCTYQLALLGAEVLKIEPPTDPDCARGRGPDDISNAEGMGLTYQVQAGNKRAIALDLSSTRGRQIFLSLVARSDVLVENYTTGALEQLGIGHDVLRQTNPRLIYCSLTGYGDTGPQSKSGAYDNVIQGVSGTIAQCGGVKPAVSFIDYSAGYSAAFAVTAALYQRQQTGRGCHISVSMLEVAMQMMSPEVTAIKHPSQQSRPAEPGIAAYDTADGQLVLGVFRPGQYRKLSALLAELGHPVPGLDVIFDWPDVWAIDDEMRNDLRATFKARTTAEWTSLLQQADLPGGSVNTLQEAARSEQLVARRYFVPSPSDANVALPLTAFRISEGGPELNSAPPRHGQHSDAVLNELGFEADAIAALRADGIIA